MNNIKSEKAVICYKFNGYANGGNGEETTVNLVRFKDKFSLEVVVRDYTSGNEFVKIKNIPKEI